MLSDLQTGQPYRKPLYGVGVTAGDVDLATQPVAVGELLAVGRVIVKDATSIATRVEVLVGHYGAQQAVAVSGALALGVPLAIEGDFYVADGEFITLRFIGTTTGDVLSAVLVGVVRYTGGPGAPVVVEE